MEDLDAPLNPLSTPTKINNCNYKDYFSYIQGDITTMKADIIVNSSAPSMMPLTGVSKSIHNKCGTSLLKFLQSKYNGILPGSFVVSPNYKLNCKVILHASGPNNLEDFHLLTNIYEQCLNYCFNNKYNSIIFPCISTGGNKVNEELACEIAINTCKLWIDKYSHFWGGKITFCCFTNDSYNIYQKKFKEILNL